MTSTSSFRRSGIALKESVRSPLVCRDAQRRADKLGRHARAPHLDALAGFAKIIVSRAHLPRQMRQFRPLRCREQRRRLDLHARSHGRGDRDPVDVVALGARPACDFCTASAKALMFSTSLSSLNEALPTPAWTMPAFSTRNSTEPPLAPLTAVVTSMVTVPTFGFGIRPRGPEHLAETADQRHQVGRGDAAVEVDGAALHLLDQVLGADDVGAGGLGLVGLGAAREHARRAPSGRSRSAD